YDLALECAKSRFFTRGLGRTNDVDDGRTAAENGHRFTVLDSFDQLRALILGVCYIAFHAFHHRYNLWLCQYRFCRGSREELFRVVVVTGVDSYQVDSTFWPQAVKTRVEISSKIFLLLMPTSTISVIS